MGLASTEPLGLGALDRRHGRRLRPVAASSRAPVAIRTAGPIVSAASSALAATWALVAVGALPVSGCALAISRVATFALSTRGTATGAVSTRATLVTSPGGEGGCDEGLILARRSEEGESLGLLALALRWKHPGDLDAVDEELSVDAQHIADRGAGRQQRCCHHAPWLLGPGGSPGPRVVVA